MREIPQIHRTENHLPLPCRPPQHALFKETPEHARKHSQHIDLQGTVHTDRPRPYAVAAAAFFALRTMLSTVSLILAPFDSQ